MAKAVEYRLWAWRMKDLAERSIPVTAPLVDAAAPSRIAGGTPAVAVDVAVRTAQASSLAVAGLLRRLADECKRRAEECAEFEAAMVEHERRSTAYRLALVAFAEQVVQAERGGAPPPGPPPWPPSEPVPPASWVGH